MGQIFSDAVILLGGGMKYLLPEGLDYSEYAITVNKFSNGETYVQIPETVRGRRVYLIKTCDGNPNDSLMEIFITLDALRRASAGDITVIIPSLAYSRQDRKAAPREPISARLIADFLEKAGASRLITFDMHCEQLQGFYKIPVDNLPGRKLLLPELRKFVTSDSVIVSPDIGGVKRANLWAQELDLPLVIVDKRRPKHNEVEVTHIIGDIKGKDLIMVDDILDTGGTMISAAKSFENMGAKSVSVAVTHPIFSKGLEAWRKAAVQNGVITRVITLDTLPHGAVELQDAHVDVVHIWEPLMRVITKLHDGKSLTLPYV